MDAMKRILPQNAWQAAQARRSDSAGPAFHCRRYRSARFRDSARRCRSYRVHVPFEWRKDGYRHRPRLHARASSRYIYAAPIAWYWSPITISICSRWGPYPWVVKQRVLKPHRASLKSCCQRISFRPRWFRRWARYLVLAHVSQENNNPDLVRLSAEEALKRRPSESPSPANCSSLPSTFPSSPWSYRRGIHFFAPLLLGSLPQIEKSFELGYKLPRSRLRPAAFFARISPSSDRTRQSISNIAMTSEFFFTSSYPPRPATSTSKSIQPMSVISVKFKPRLMVRRRSERADFLGASESWVNGVPWFRARRSMFLAERA